MVCLGRPYPFKFFKGGLHLKSQNTPVLSSFHGLLHSDLFIHVLFEADVTTIVTAQLCCTNIFPHEDQRSLFQSVP